MSTLNKLKEKADESNYLSLQDLGQQINAKLEGDLVFKSDKRGNDSCYLTLIEQETMRPVVQKFGKSLYALLYNKIVACGGIEPLQQGFFVWKREKAGRATNDRYFPIAPTKKK